MSHTDSGTKEKRDVYYERNVLALAYIAIQHASVDGVTGWYPDEDDVNADEWAVVWANTPEGQVGWHVPTDMVPAWLPKRNPDYDGYTTGEKHRRLHHHHGIPYPVAPTVASSALAARDAADENDDQWPERHEEIDVDAIPGEDE